MRTIAFMVIVVWMLPLHTRACDVCGCSASGSFMGILPQYQKHFVGLAYQYQSFHSLHPETNGVAVPEASNDYFQSATLWGRFYPTGRLQTFVFLPYHYNYVQESGSTTVMNGIGDVRLLANYMLVNTADSTTRTWKHTLLAGGGIKLPTGKNGYVNQEGIVLSNMQPGTGSWDVLFNANYTTRYKSIGFNADVNYQLSTVNRRNYKYGDKLTVGVMAFAWLPAGMGKLTVLPQVGFRYQYSAIDLSSATYDIRNTYSGGYQLYATMGSGLYINRLALTGLFSLPVSQHYAGGLVTANPRLEMQIQYLF